MDDFVQDGLSSSLVCRHCIWFQDCVRSDDFCSIQGSACCPLKYLEVD